mgnify:CR=1 FL=1
MILSIITVNRNNAKGLRATIESVLAQTCREFEFIVIDGNSDDGSKEVVEEYKDLIDFSVSEPDKGIYNAMNKGIAHANGDYCLFMNSGDKFFNNEVMEKIKLAVNAGADHDFLAGDSLWYNSEGKQWMVYAPDVMDTFFMRTGSLCHQSVLTRTSILKQTGYDEQYKIVADWMQMSQQMILGHATYQRLPFTIATVGAEGFSLSHVDIYHKEREQGIHQLFPVKILEAIDALLPLYQAQAQITQRHKNSQQIQSRQLKVMRCFEVGGNTGNWKLLRNSFKWWLHDLFSHNKS